MQRKKRALQEQLSREPKAAIAFSGGVDSTFLLKTAYDVLGDNVLAVIVQSAAFPEREQKEAREFCRQLGIPYAICCVEAGEIPHFTENPPERCYYCKKAMFQKIIQAAKEHHISFVAEGSNMDDNSDYRPGHRAVAELGIASPLRKAGLYKEEIRQLSKEMNLPTWSKPSFACLASRFPYGEEISNEKLRRVERAEELLFSHGFRQFRVRVHRDVARIEVLPDDFPRLLEEKTRGQFVEKFKSYGFTYVSLDLQGYRTGSMNETIPGGGCTDRNESWSEK